MIKKNIKVYCNTDALHEVIQPETKTLTHDRCKVKIIKHTNNIEFQLAAKDKTAAKTMYKECRNIFCRCDCMSLTCNEHKNQ